MRRAIASLGLLAVLAGCATQAAGFEGPLPSSTRVLSPNAIVMDFDEQDPLLTTTPGRVAVKSVPTGSSNLILVQSGDGTSALRFPTWSGEVDAARLALVMTPTAKVDPLNPGTRSFKFGADVRLDAKSTGPGEDNGDNVLQRGLFSDTTQYKLQVDKRVPSCRLMANGVNLLVKLPQALDDGWFRITCERSSRKLSVTAHRLTLDGEEFFDHASVSGVVMNLNFPRSTRVSIGGKITRSGELVLKQSDQFNGELDNVFIDIDSTAR